MRTQSKATAEPYIDVRAIDVAADIATPVAPISRSQSSAKKLKLLAIFGGAAILAIVVGVAYQFWRRPPPPPPAPMVGQASPTTATPSGPVVRNPVPAPASDAALPSLADSDGTVANALAEVFSRDAMAKFLYVDGIVHRFVATVDNLPRRTVALRVTPLRSVPGSFVTTSQGGRLVVASENSARYAPYVQTLDAVDTHTLVALYLRFYPLLQEAYVELGYPNGYFNDRLVEAIDSVLATPEPAGAITLVQPKVTYQFADSELEALPAGQKILLRMGPGNAAKVRAKLAEIRRQIAREQSPTQR